MSEDCVNQVQEFVNRYGHTPSSNSSLGKFMLKASKADPKVLDRCHEITRGLDALFVNKEVIAKEFLEAWNAGEDVSEWANVPFLCQCRRF